MCLHIYLIAWSVTREGRGSVIGRLYIGSGNAGQLAGPVVQLGVRATSWATSTYMMSRSYMNL